MNSDNNLMFSVQGKIVRINPAKTFAKSGSKSRSFWIEHTSQPNNDGKTFTKTLEFEIFSRGGSKFDNTADLDKFGVGTFVKFNASPNGSVWQNPNKPNDPPRCFVSLRVIGKIEVVGRATNPAPSSAPSPAVPPQSLGDAQDAEMPF